MTTRSGPPCHGCAGTTYRASCWSLADDWVCAGCGARYTPPMPLAGHVLLLLAGLAVGALARL